MTITVRFFASIREKVGKEAVSLESAGVQSAADAWAQATNAPMPPNTLTAVNHEYVRPDEPVKDGDEVAFFPPVTGG